MNELMYTVTPNFALQFLVWLLFRRNALFSLLFSITVDVLVSTSTAQTIFLVQPSVSAHSNTAEPSAKHPSNARINGCNSKLHATVSGMAIVSTRCTLYSYVYPPALLKPYFSFNLL